VREREREGERERERELRMFYEYDNEDCGDIRNAFRSRKNKKKLNINKTFLMTHRDFTLVTK